MAIGDPFKNVQQLEMSYISTGFSSQIRAKLRDWAVSPGRAGFPSWAELSTNDSKTRPFSIIHGPLHTRSPWSVNYYTKSRIPFNIIPFGPFEST